MRRPAVYLVLLVMLLGLASPAIAQDATPAGSSVFQELGLTDLPVTATDEGLTMAAEVPAGQYRLVFTNDGSAQAYLELYKLDDGMTVESLVAAFEEVAESDAPPAFFYDLVINGGATAVAGGTGEVVLDLDAGNWVFNYFFFDESTGEDVNIPTAVTVTGEAPTPIEVPADVTVEMFEMDFAITGDIQPGSQIWEVTNTGEQPHFLIISRYPEPFDEADVMALLESQFAPPATPEAGASPVASPVAGLNFELFADLVDTPVISTGRTNWYAIDLTPGHYVALCFITDPETGAPHAMLGMIETFEITE